MKKSSTALIIVAMLVSTLALSPAVRAQQRQPEFYVNCTTASVGGLSGFNQEATCNRGDTAGGGGYFLATTDFSQLLAASVSENMFVFSGTTPVGWEVVGTNNTTIAGSIRVCVSCAQPDQQRH